MRFSTRYLPATLLALLSFSISLCAQAGSKQTTRLRAVQSPAA